MARFIFAFAAGIGVLIIAASDTLERMVMPPYCCW